MPKLPVSTRSAMPAAAPNAVQTARTLYVLETRRRNLQIKQQITQAKLERIQNELANIEAQLARLNNGQVPAAPPPVVHVPDDATFSLDY